MENKEEKKEITLDDIAELIKSSSEKTEKRLEAKIDSSIGGLAAMTQKEFLAMDEKMNAGFKSVKNDIAVIKEDVKELNEKVDNFRAELNKKVDIFRHNDLKFRVEKLEEKTA